MPTRSDLLSDKYTFLRFLKTKSDEALDGYKRTIRCLRTILPIRSQDNIEQNKQTDWPGRVMFPEQILGIPEDESLWYVYVRKRRIETTEFKNACISKCHLPKTKIEYQVPITDPDELMQIDEATDSPFDYYLQARQQVELLYMVGIGAFTINRFYCTFHNKDAAMLYAESLDAALHSNQAESVISSFLEDDK